MTTPTDITELERLAKAAKHDNESLIVGPAAILELISINRELIDAAEKLMAGLHQRIRDAKDETPVFTGIAGMHNALNRAKGESNNDHPIPQWMRDAFSTIENCAPSQNGMQVFTQMRTVVQSYFQSHPSPAESDKEAVRNAALDEAISECNRLADMIGLIGVKGGAKVCSDALRALKSQPAQPSDSQAEPSDSEMLDWLAKKGFAVVDCGESYDVLDPHYGASTWLDVDSPTPREAIKAAMRAEMGE